MKTFSSTPFLLSDHARKRAQQRGISANSVANHLIFGKCFNAGNGRLAYHIGARNIKAASRVGIYIDDLKNTAIVVSDDTHVVTIEHVKRIPRYWTLISKGRV